MIGNKEAVRSGDLIFFGGIVARDAAGVFPKAYDVEGQTELIIRRIEAYLRGQDLSLDNLVSVNGFPHRHTGLRPDEPCLRREHAFSPSAPQGHRRTSDGGGGRCRNDRRRDVEPSGDLESPLQPMNSDRVMKICPR